MKSKLSKWFYEFKHGHPQLIKEEAEIIVDTRINQRSNDWMNDYEIQELIKLKVKAMYRNKFPLAKRWTFPSTKP